MKVKSNTLSIILSLLAGGWIGTLSPALQAQEIFGNSGIQFEQDTIIEFEFLESHGGYQSTFGVINLVTGEKTPLIEEVKPADFSQTILAPSDFSTDLGLGNDTDFLGTPGNAVPQPLAEFQFQANTPYAFYLESSYNGQPAGILYSTSTQNPGTNQQVLFEGGMPGLASGGVLLRWDDTGSLLVRENQQDRDFDDFVVRAGGHVACPYGNNAREGIRSSQLQAKQDSCSTTENRS